MAGSISSISPLSSGATTVGVTCTVVVGGRQYRIRNAADTTAFTGGGAVSPTATPHIFTLSSAAGAPLPTAGNVVGLVFSESATVPATWVVQNNTATIGRQCGTPTVPTQTFSTAVQTPITHAISSTAGTGGTQQWNVTTSSTAPTTGWTTTNSFSLDRGTTYWFWSRQFSATTSTNWPGGLTSNNASVSQTVPIIEPTVGTQTFAGTQAAAITHVITYTDGAGGTLQFNVTTSSTTPTTGWTTTNSFINLNRGTTYWFWARRSTAGTSNVSQTIPFLDPDTDASLSGTPPINSVISPAASSYTINRTGQSTPSVYRLILNPSTVIGTGTQNTYTISGTELPANPGETYNYTYQTRLSPENGGNNTWVSTTGTNATFFITREDAQPDDFTFTSQTNVARSTTRTSNTITISGLGAGVTVPVTVFGGDPSTTFSINGGAFGTTGSVTNGSTIAVQHTSSSSYNTIVSSTISVGGSGQEIVRAFFSTTLQQPPTGINYSLTDPAIKDNDVTVSMSATGGVAPYEYSIDGVSGWTTTNTFAGVRGTLYNRYARSTGPSSPAGPFSYTPPYLDPPSTITNSGWSTTAPAYNNVNDITFTVTVPETGNGVYYQLRRDSISPVGFFDGAVEVGLTKVITLSYPIEIPPPNTTYTYNWRAQRYSPQGGDGNYGSNITSGTNPSFTVTRDNIPAPTGLNASTSADNDPNPTVTVSASGGINLDYNITFGPALPSTGWSAGGSFTATTDTSATLTRGDIYYIWARSNYTYNGTNYTRAISSSYTIPFIQPDLTLTAGSQTTFVEFNNTNSIFYSWTGNTSPTRYIIEREGPPNTWSFVTLAEKNSSGRTLQWDENDIPPPGNSANYRVSGNVLTADGGTQIWSPTNLAWTLTRGAVSPPTSITITPSSSPEPTTQLTVVSSPIYGTAEYSVNPTSGFSTSNIFDVIRGSNFSVFARNAYVYVPNGTTYYSSSFNAVLNPVPYLSPDTSINAISAINVSPGATSYTVGITNGETHTIYEIRDTSYTGTVLAQAAGAGTGTANIVVNNVPAQGATKTYYVTGFRTGSTGGAGSPGVQNVTTFNVNSVITAPIVQNTQTFSTATQSVINHTIAMTSLGEGSPVEYAISKSATYNTSVVRAWQSSPSFTGANGVKRGSPYYFWARITDNATFADASLENTVPFLSPPNSVTSSPTSFATLASNDTTDRSIELKAVSVDVAGVYYRFRRTNGVSPVSIGSYEPNNDPPLPKNILISPSDLPPQGATWTYYWEAQRYIFAGGDAQYDPVTGSGSSFTITRDAADTTPSPFDFGNIGRVALNTIVYTNELQITGFDTTTSISISGQGSPEYKISNSAGTSPDAGTWTSATGTISPDKYVRLRHRSSNISDTTLTSTVTIGGVQDSFTSQSFRMPQYGVGTVTAGSTLLDSNNTSDVTVSWTSPDSFAQYRIRRLDYDPVNNPNPTTTVVTTTGTGSPSLTLLYSEADLPSAGYSGTYRLQTRIATAQGGNGTWYAARTPGNNDAIVEFTINRIGAPEVLQGQPFDLYSPVSTITHPIALAAAGKYGTVEYNVTSAASAGLTAGAAPTTGWTTSNYRSINRNSSYWFWARRSNNNNISVKLSETVPAAINDYGFLLYSSTGQLLMDSTSLTARRIAYGTVTGSGTATFPITVPISGRTAGNTSIVVSTPTPLTITEGTNSIPPLYVTGITFGANSVSFQINYNVGLTMAAYYYVLAEG